jgi:hypothetical protein
VSPVKYELGFYIPEDDILHSHHRENLKSYIMKLVRVEIVCRSFLYRNGASPSSKAGSR